MKVEMFMVAMWYIIVQVEGGPPHNMAEITPICFADTKSETQFGVFLEYTEKYCDAYSPEEISKVWNGGPRGMQKRATEPYWEKIQNEMEKLRQEAE
jgi:hypothetical protein